MAWPTKTDFVDGDVLTAAQVNNIGTNLNVFNPTSATNGQVWVANGSGSGAYATPVSGGWTLINSGTMSGTSITSSTFSDYRQLHLDLVGVTVSGATPVGVRLNGLSTSIYARLVIQPTSASAWTNDLSTGDTYTSLGNPVDTVTYSVDIYNASQANAMKNIVSVMTTTNASWNRKIGFGQASIAAALTSVTILTVGGPTFTAGNYYFYGLK